MQVIYFIFNALILYRKKCVYLEEELYFNWTRYFSCDLILDWNVCGPQIWCSIFKKKCQQYRYFIYHLRSIFSLINFNCTFYYLWMMQQWLVTQGLVIKRNSAYILVGRCSFSKCCHHQVNCNDRLTRLCVYYEHRLTFPIVYQSYHTMRVYFSIVQLSYHIVRESYRNVYLVKITLLLLYIFPYICIWCKLWQ